MYVENNKRSKSMVILKVLISIFILFSLTKMDFGGDVSQILGILTSNSGISSNLENAESLNPTVTLGLLASIFLKFVILFSILIGMFYSIINFERLYKYYNLSDKKKGLLMSVYLSSILTLFINPLNPSSTYVNKFDRVMGAGLIANFDMSRVIDNFRYWFVFFGLSLFLLCILTNYINNKAKTENQQKALDFIDKIVVIAVLNLVLIGITYFNKKSTITSIVTINNVVNALTIAFMYIYIILSLDKHISFKAYLQLLITELFGSIIIMILLPVSTKNSLLLMCVQILIASISILMIKLKNIDFATLEEQRFLDATVIVFSTAPLVLAIFIELLSILNQHSIFIAKPQNVYIVISINMILLTYLLQKYINKKNINLEWWKNWSYPIIILGISALMATIPLTSYYVADIFESANYGVLINDFLNYGEIPLVETYGHHMLTSVLEGVFYGILNNDYGGAIFSPYSSYTSCIKSLLFFYFIKEVIDEDTALFATLTMPFLGYWGYMSFGILICLTTVIFLRNSTYKTSTIYWLSIIWCSLMRADLGYTFGIASFVIIFGYLFINKNKSLLKIIFLPISVIGTIGVILWCGLCLINEINPVSRLYEFLKMFDASINWSYATIGDNKVFAYSIAYMFIPLFVVGGMILVCLSSNIRKNIEKQRIILMLMLGMTYLVNFSRSIVRHNLVETSLDMMMFTFFAYFGMFVSIVTKKKNWFLPAYLGIVLFIFLLKSHGNYEESSILVKGLYKIEENVGTWNLTNIQKQNNEITVWQELSDNQEVVERVMWEPGFEQMINQYQLINELLDNDETFLDFAYVSFLYPALNRQDPVYIAQSPTMLTGERTQKYFLEEIEKNKENIPLAIMPDSLGSRIGLDGIKNNNKYYLVSEYIYNNFQPLYEGIGFSLWAENSRYDEFAAIIEDQETSKSIIENFMSFEQFDKYDCNIIKDSSDGSITLEATGIDPQITNIVDIDENSEYIGSDVIIEIYYEKNDITTMQMFYTTDESERFSEEKSRIVNSDQSGIAKFKIPITKYTKLRFDISENSSIKINDIKIINAKLGFEGTLIEWGFDSAQHGYNLQYLPYIWGQYDKGKAVENPVVATTENVDGQYVFDKKLITKPENGNYLIIQTDKLSVADESAKVILGSYENGEFTAMYNYTFTLVKGNFNYIFRVSSDYYWHLNKINAIRIESDSELFDTKVNILQGD